MCPLFMWSLQRWFRLRSWRSRVPDSLHWLTTALAGSHFLPRSMPPPLIFNLLPIAEPHAPASHAWFQFATLERIECTGRNLIHGNPKDGGQGWADQDRYRRLDLRTVARDVLSARARAKARARIR